MLRRPRFFILACFLVAITSNFIQVAQVSVSKADPSERSLLSETPDAQQDDSAFIVPGEDDSDETPVLLVAQTTIENIQSTLLSLRLNASTAVSSAERHMVLRL